MNKTDADKRIKKIEALLAKADGTDFPEEAAVFRAKAEALMIQWRIEESMLAAAGSVDQGFAPEWVEWNVCDTTNEFRDAYRRIASWVVRHIGAEAVFKYEFVTDEDGNNRHMIVADVVGYNSDLRYGHLLLTSAILAFGQLMEPRYNADESDQVNAYRMRKAGMEGRRIAMAIWKSDAKALRPKARKLYEAEAKLRGENPAELLGQGNSVKTYRESYAEGFTNELWSRLNRMKIEAGEHSQAIVLAGRSEAVKEAFYTKYPQYRPAKVAGKLGNPAETCSKCAKAKSGFCREHSYLRPRVGKERSFNYRAYTRGQDAASTVDLGVTKRLTN